MANSDGWDFRGWATKSNILVSDGVIIHSDAFSKDNGIKVPLVWNHQRNEPGNILGHVELQHRDKGTYAFGFFNDSENAKLAKQELEHGDISAMSIGANRIQRQGQDVISGHIFEVSLVVSGANPGALIDEVVQHNDEVGESAVIYNGLLIHSSEDEQEFTKGSTMATDTGTTEATAAAEVEETDPKAILASMTPEQLAFVDSLVDGLSDEEEPTEEDTGEQQTMVQHNAFSAAEGTAAQADSTVLEHAALNELIIGARDSNAGSFRKYIEQNADAALLEHADYANKGVTNVEALFPDAHLLTPTPTIVSDPNTNTSAIVNAVSKSPFSRVKAMYTEISEADFRAKGYIKGDQKVDDVITIAQRETTPQTVYIHQTLDRDDVIDIEDFDITTWMQGILRGKLNDELARAILVGDGRLASDRYKIKADKIRPIWSDDDLFTIKKTTPTLASFITDMTLAKAELRGSGKPTMYINPLTLARMQLLKNGQGNFLFGIVPTQATLTSILGVSSVQETTWLPEGAVLLVNLNDYTFGASKGGQVTSFDDFDIDFNQYKYLIETRVSGALVNPKTALAMTITDPTTDVKWVQDVKNTQTGGIGGV